MNLFGDLPQERAMVSLIHDTNRDLSWADSIIYNRVALNADEIDKLKRALKAVKDDIDAYYTKFKKDFEQ